MKSLPLLILLAQKGLAFSLWDTDSQNEEKKQADEKVGFWTTTSFPCGDNYYGINGEFLSPNYPFNYPNNADCEWIVEGGGEDDIVATVEFLDMETCCDYLEIRDGKHSGAPLLAELTGHIAGKNATEIYGTGSYMYFRFVSDYSVTRKGFQISWTTNDMDCGGYIYDDAGTIESPYYPNLYPNDADCFWVLIGPEGSTISVTIDDFSTEEDFDYLGFYDGYDGDWNPCLGNFTGQLPSDLQEITSTDNVMSVWFTSDYSGRDTGFKFDWYLTGSHPPTHRPTPPPVGQLQCYSCIGCDTIDDDTNVVSSEDYLACFVAVEIGHDHFVFRGGSPDYYEDGSCRHEADGAIVCYCTSNLCNDDEALKRLLEEQK